MGVRNPPAALPDGASLHFTLECRTSKDTPSPVSHPVTLHADWSVELPHDLQAERVATAFGAYTSCLDFVDTAVPAFRDGLAVLLRRARLPLRHDAQGWKVRPSAPCCRRATFASAALAATHLRSVDHLASRRRALPWQVAALVAAFDEEFPTARQPPRHRVAGRIREVGGLRELWRCGLHPDQVAQFADLAREVTEPLPLRYYLAMAHGAGDIAWFAAVIGARLDPDVATWLAEVPAPRDLGPPEVWAQWLGIGLPRSTILTLLEAEVDAEEAQAISVRLGEPLPVVANELARWAQAGCRPGVDHVVALRRHGIAHPVPSSAAIDDLCDELGEHDPQAREWMSPARTEAAVLLSILQTRAAVPRHARRGIRRVADLSTDPTTLQRTP